ncbi:MAG: hypothetical protein WC842_02685 [Candidatus Paceibacterota bacterium]|jgi:hypothetical protein
MGTIVRTAVSNEKIKIDISDGAIEKFGSSFRYLDRFIDKITGHSGTILGIAEGDLYVSMDVHNGLVTCYFKDDLEFLKEQD